ncbi:thioredoxin-like domain-containing protein [Rubritalea tangerina]|uniref:Thioredoxin-like domain-containing protein n=2 Tax=Rubritalea tangerina TaxID=430798 RepID=A0ABW4ZCK8_9BACT
MITTFAKLSLFAFITFKTLANAKEPAPPVKELLFSSRDPLEFHTALQQAKEQNLPKQTLLEAQFLYLIDQQDTAGLAALSVPLTPLFDAFNPDHSEIFTLEDDWKAIIRFTQALKALEQNKPREFKETIKSAFWHSPRQASVFAPHIDQFKVDQSMLKVQFNFNKPYLKLLEPKAYTFNKNAKANLLIFWSPWSQEFIETIDDFKALCEITKSNDISNSTILTELSDEAFKDAKQTIQELSLQQTTHWIADSNDNFLARTLRIQSIPTVVLVNKEGKVKFNGHPSNKKFWLELKKIVPNLERPKPQ